MWTGFLAGVAGILALLFLTSSADYVVAVLSLLATFVFGYLTIFPLPWGTPLVTTPRRVLLVAGVCVVGLLVGAGAYFLVIEPEVVVRARTVTVESSRDLGGDSNIGPGAPAVVRFPGPVPDRRYLGLQLSLRQNLDSGDCLSGARATLVPRLNGIQAAATPVESLGMPGRAPSTTEIALGGPIDDLRIDVLLDTDPGCRVELIVTEASFYGAF